MGIPYYFYNLYKKYSNTNLMIDEYKLRQIYIQHVFFDYNSMIHPCSQKVLELYNSEENTSIKNTTIENTSIENDIILECIRYTRYVIDLLKPKNAYIMIDGVAPMGKINQQRERRYKSKFTKNKTNNKITWDSNKITPGTLFMSKIKNSLILLKQELKDVCELYISDSDECGEGEHKMMKYISNNLIDTTEKICIYGLDADLIMLSLLNKKYKNIILLRDNSFNQKLKESQRVFTYLDISQLYNAIYNDVYSQITNQYNIQLQIITKESIIKDYIFMCFLLGNDFLEHLPNVLIKYNGINIIIKTYIKVLAQHNYQTITVNNNINMDMLRDIIYHIGNSEDYFFSNVYKENNTIFKDEQLLDSIKQEDIIVYKQDLIKYNLPNYKKRYYIYYGICNIDDVCKNYIEGLNWVWGYYNNHNHNNWSWFYKYKAAPFPSDLYRYLSKDINNLKLYIVQCEHMKESIPITQMQQLYMVLPRESLLEVIKEIDKLGYEKLQRIFKSNSKDIDNIFPNRITLDLINKEYIWQSKIFFNNFEKDILNLLI